MSLRTRFVAFTLLLPLLLAPLSAARAAGGEIRGTVTDPKGAVVVVASVTVAAYKDILALSVENKKQ